MEIDLTDKIGLFWDKSNGKFLAIAYKDKDGNDQYKVWEDWDYMYNYLSDKDGQTYLRQNVDWVQTEMVELMHKFGNSICTIHVNCRPIKIC